MKTFYLIVAGFGFSLSVHAQFRDTVYVIPKRNENNLKSFSLITPGAKILSKNERGKIYRLPVDNMLCLVPNLKNVVPIPTKKLYQQNGQMPNKTPKLPF